jgi:ABC-2 type transport system permease protein
MDEIFIGVTVPIAMLAFFLGASFMGAEWQKGTMTTTLTWENRRWAVFGAKAVVVIIGSLALFVVLQALLALFLLPSALFRGTTEGSMPRGGKTRGRRWRAARRRLSWPAFLV